jgi:FkbM family methyltransferase
VKPSSDLARSLWLYRLVLSIRPAQLGDFAKKLCRFDRIEVTTVNGTRFWIDPVSVFGLAMLENHEYEKPLTTAVTTLLNPGDSFVDVGANEGYFSVLAAQKVGPQGQVLAIEPQARLRGVLERNIAANSLTNVDIVSAAVADKEGKTLLYLRPSTNTGASSFTKHWRFGNRAEEVQTTTLDRLLSERHVASVRVMKVDCEGAESLVIAGAERSLGAQVIQFLTVEYHTAICESETCRQAHQTIRGHGYDAVAYGGLILYFQPVLAPEVDQLKNTTSVPDWLN